MAHANFFCHPSSEDGPHLPHQAGLCARDIPQEFWTRDGGGHDLQIQALEACQIISLIHTASTAQSAH